MAHVTEFRRSTLWLQIFVLLLCLVCVADCQGSRVSEGGKLVLIIMGSLMGGLFLCGMYFCCALRRSSPEESGDTEAAATLTSQPDVSPAARNHPAASAPPEFDLDGHNSRYLPTHEASHQSDVYLDGQYSGYHSRREADQRRSQHRGGNPADLSRAPPPSYDAVMSQPAHYGCR